jgi:hypothetical protein
MNNITFNPIFLVSGIIRGKSRYMKNSTRTVHTVAVKFVAQQYWLGSLGIMRKSKIIVVSGVFGLYMKAELQLGIGDRF